MLAAAMAAGTLAGGLVGALALLSSSPTAEPHSATRGAGRIGTSASAAHSADRSGAVRRLLKANGIADVRFGQTPAIVAAAVERLLGRPASASPASPTGYVRADCGYHDIRWEGLDVNDAQLYAWFRRSRFVGYSYFPSGPGGRVITPPGRP